MNFAAQTSEPLVIGAGPAGISIARALQSHGLSATLLERTCVASTWKRVPSNLRVLSPWWTNILELNALFHANPISKVPARKMSRHFDTMASGLDIQNPVSVKNVVHDGASWIVVDSLGRKLSTRAVVCATGYFGSPHIPEFVKNSDRSITTCHAADIRDLDKFCAALRGLRVLIVGKRVTAGQLLVEFQERGLNVDIAAKSSIEFRRSGVYGWLREQLYFIYEEVKFRANPDLQGNSYPIMDGGRPEYLISTKQVSVMTEPVEIRNGTVLFSDNSVTGYDQIILATGYRPTLDYLPKTIRRSNYSGLPVTEDFEVVDAPGIFLLGYDNIRNQRSRYLRGIRSDSVHLAGRIAKRLQLPG